MIFSDPERKFRTLKKNPNHFTLIELGNNGMDTVGLAVMRQYPIAWLQTLNRQQGESMCVCNLSPLQSRRKHYPFGFPRKLPPLYSPRKRGDGMWR